MLNRVHQLNSSDENNARFWICSRVPYISKYIQYGTCFSAESQRICMCHRRYLHCNENPIYVFPEKNLQGLSHNFHIHVYVRDLYCIFLGSIHIFFCNRIGIGMGMYKSLTNTWMWELGLRPHNSFSGNFCFKFSVLWICSVFHAMIKGVIQNM